MLTLNGEYAVALKFFDKYLRKNEIEPRLLRQMAQFQSLTQDRIKKFMKTLGII